jgi:hypothetical protein|tara:strand:- start:203 stop:1042 length:840 start_codon:yes stop_codon:yes gene_type:complete
MDSIDITPTKGFPHMYDFIGDKVTKGSPIVLVVLTFVIIIYYILFSYLGVSVVEGAKAVAPSPSITFIEVVMWGMFIFLVLINGVQYFFQVDIKTSIRNLFTPVPEVDITVTSPQPPPVPEIMYEDQVFHIPDNIYTYNDAKAVCKAYGSRLATYEEIENAYKRGAEWCGFGWSADQMALYPTQMETWKKLQKRKGHKHDCGRPGINGGFIAYKKAPFGVNCYGHKPKITPEERELMDNEELIPLSPEERRFKKKVEKYRKDLPEILVSPFNYDNWSQL